MIPLQTRLAAWQEVRKELSFRQREVFLILRQMGGKATMHEVALRLFKPLNTISGRFSELREKGLIEPAEIDRTPGHRPRTVWRVR